MHITEIETTLSSFTRQWDNGSSSTLSKPNPKYWTVLLPQQNDPKWAAAFLKRKDSHHLSFLTRGQRGRNRWHWGAGCWLLGEVNGEMWSWMKIDPISSWKYLLFHFLKFQINDRYMLALRSEWMSHNVLIYYTYLLPLYLLSAHTYGVVGSFSTSQ